MPAFPITVGSDSEYSRGATAEFGVTTDDTAGQMYIETSGRAYFTPAKVAEVYPALKAAFDKATADAKLARLSLKIPVDATDQQIVDAVRALLPATA